ncbi:MAG: hypothetical protein QXL10_05560 [Candidatus Bathyarchaeia archaeon]
MVSSTIDHMVAVMAFLAATLLFIGLFNQTIQTGVIYQRHKALATKASDLLDTILLNSGVPDDWGRMDGDPIVFGLQDRGGFTQYRLSPFSLMRLHSSLGSAVYYEKADMTYSNVTVGFGNCLLMPYDGVLNYSTALRLMGLNGSYGFQLAFTPMVNVSIAEEQTNPLKLAVNVSGIGFSLASATLSYRLIAVVLNETQLRYLSGENYNGTVRLDDQGRVTVPFSLSVDENVTYCFIAYAHLGGVTGVGAYVRESSSSSSVIPFVNSLASREVILAHSADVPYTASFQEDLVYNATLVSADENWKVETLVLDGASGTVICGAGYAPGVITMPRNCSGTLAIAYKSAHGVGGFVLVPWGVGGFPVVFGDAPAKQEWVATDTRQVMVNGIAYQAKLALWSLEGYQVVS